MRQSLPLAVSPLDNYCTRQLRLRLFRSFTSSVTRIKKSNVLIYWPHGFGDWVFLSYILPLLEPTNRYWITRFGDDTVSLMEGNNWVLPLYTGVLSPNCYNGGIFGNTHFGANLNDADGTEQLFHLPPALHDACINNR